MAAAALKNAWASRLILLRLHNQQNVSISCVVTRYLQDNSHSTLRILLAFLCLYFTNNKNIWTIWPYIAFRCNFIKLRDFNQDKLTALFA